MTKPRSRLNSSSALCRSFLLLVNFCVIFGPMTYATCYFPNGDIRVDQFYQPCHPDQEHSMCCRIDDNRCRSDGLCDELGTSLVWRESCTDPTWNSSSCIKLCHSGLGILCSKAGKNEIMLMRDQVLDVQGQESGDQAAYDHLITPCDDGSYCCGSGVLATNCCKENRGLFLKNGTAVSRDSTPATFDVVSSSSIKATPSSSSAAAFTLGQSLSALAPTAPASSTSATKTSNQTGVIVGAAISGAAVLALVTGIIVLIGMRRIKKRSRIQETLRTTRTDESHQDPKLYEGQKSNSSRELATLGPVPELENSKKPQRPVPELQNFEPNRPLQEL